MSALHCFFCGGKECKYENWKLWSGEKYQGVNAIDGLFSSWITSNILAMQRPSTRLIKEFDLIRVFKEKGIGAVFNLQSKGEHVSCGDGVEISSGFSYIPEVFIENDIKYYNFGWTDMDTPDVNLMLNIVNVMAYAIEDMNEKIAVHCHAGLGRTGLSIACYLIYSENIPAETAILIVRGKRPLSVQTRKQSMFVIGFEKHLKKLKNVFPHAVEKSQKLILNITPMTFTDHIDNQRRWLRNPDLRFLRYIPKIVHLIINRIMTLCAEKELNWYATLDSFVFEKQTEKIASFQEEINSSEWGCIKMETNVNILVDLLIDWFINLKEPLLNEEKVKAVSSKNLSWEEKVEIIGKEEFETINLVLEFFRQMPSISKNTLDLALESLTTIFTEERSTLKRFINPNPPIPKPQIPTDNYGSRMLGSFKAMSIRSIVHASESGLTVNTSTDNSIESVASLSVFQNIQKSAEALTHVAVGSATLAINGVAAAVSKPVSHEFSSLLGVSGKEKKVDVVHKANVDAAEKSWTLITPVSPKSTQDSEKKSFPDSHFIPEKNDGSRTPISPETQQNAPDRLPVIEVTDEKNVDKSGTNSTSSSGSVTTAEELQNRNESIKLLLHHIYKTCGGTIPELGSNTSTDMNASQSHVWTSPVEILQQLPKGSMTDNLAEKFADQKPTGYNSNDNLKGTNTTMSYSVSDLPSFFTTGVKGIASSLNMQGNNDDYSEPVALGPLSKRKSSSLGFLPLEAGAIAAGMPAAIISEESALLIHQ